MEEQLTVEQAMERLRQLGVVDDSPMDYYKIPITDFSEEKLNNGKEKEKVTSKHTLIIDSRQRDYSLYPEPNDYIIELLESHRNVQKIELIAAMIPKTDYNVNSENNLIELEVNGVTELLFLKEGQYLIGSNVIGNRDYIANGQKVCNGLLNELNNTLNTHSESNGNNFNVFLATAPSPMDLGYPSTGTGQNASILNRIVITNDTNSFTINFNTTSPFRVLGFPKKVVASNLDNYIYSSDDLGTCNVTNLLGTPHKIGINSIISEYDYDLSDDPNYIIMDLEFGNHSGERVESIDVATNRKFAIILYDSNDPDVLQTYSYNPDPYGPLKLGTDRKPGRIKALKGTDFDKKILEFSSPIILENFRISFFKYNNTLYNFHNREHLLTFELEVVDFDPKFRY